MPAALTHAHPLATSLRVVTNVTHVLNKPLNSSKIRDGWMKLRGRDGEDSFNLGAVLRGGGGGMSPVRGLASPTGTQRNFCWVELDILYKHLMIIIYWFYVKNCMYDRQNFSSDHPHSGDFCPSLPLQGWGGRSAPGLTARRKLWTNYAQRFCVCLTASAFVLDWEDAISMFFFAGPGLCRWSEKKLSVCYLVIEILWPTNFYRFHPRHFCQKLLNWDNFCLCKPTTGNVRYLFLKTVYMCKKPLL